MGYKMNRNAASPFNFGEGTGRSPLNQVRGQQRMNPSTLKPHVEHGTGRGSRTGKGIKHSHTV